VAARHDSRSTQQVETQHKDVLQVLWLPPQVAVQMTVAPPATSCRLSNPQRVSLESMNFLVGFFN
jgi:hypothetical protein